MEDHLESFDRSFNQSFVPLDMDFRRFTAPGFNDMPHSMTPDPDLLDRNDSAENSWLWLSSATQAPTESLAFASHQSSNAAGAIFDLYGGDDELEDAESAVDDILFFVPETSELGSLLPLSSQSSSDDLALSREVSIGSRLSSTTSLSSKSFRIPPKAKSILESWLEANAEHPYLKPGDPEALAHLTCLTATQVKNFVANGRLRRLSTNAALSQASSTLSLPSYNSSSSSGPRKGRKRYRLSTSPSFSSAIATSHDPGKIYQCTFCPNAFSRKGDWKRHEQASHVPQEEWVCTPEFPVFMSEEGRMLCAYCEQDAPDEMHLQELHRYQVCLSKPEVEKTFNRKDKLQQHVAQVHKQMSLSAHAASSWIRHLDRNLRFCCGFCSETLETWALRSDHIAAHFENGLNMSSWQGPVGGILD